MVNYLDKWRLIIDPPLTARVNMQKDLDLLAEVGAKKSLPVLRFYRWSPPAVSLGFFQKEEEVVNSEACQSLGLDVVKRPTGGRAVIHHEELTYSMIVPENHPFVKKGGVLEVYKKISTGLVEAFLLLGIKAVMAPPQSNRPGLAAGSCFDTPSDYEIQVAGKKVVGSAQLRRRGIILQHGSILLRLPEKLYKEALLKKEGVVQNLADDHLHQRAAGLLDLGYQVSYEELTQALVKAFSCVIPADFN